MRDLNGFIWLWHGTDEPADDPAWFDLPAPPVAVGAEQIWDVHYSRFMEAALDFHHVPFVHRRYVPGVGPVVRDAEVVHDCDHIRMTGALTTSEGRRPFPFEGEVLMPCTLWIVAAGTNFVAAGTPVDDHRTWVAALYRPTYTARVPIVRRIEGCPRHVHRLQAVPTPGPHTREPGRELEPRRHLPVVSYRHASGSRGA